MVRFDARMKRVPQTWVVLANYAEAKIFARQCKAHKLPRGLRKFIDDEEYELAEVPDGQLRAESSRPQHDFANDIAGYLNHAGADGRFERLVLVAPAAVLDVLREKLREVIQERVVAELPQQPGSDNTAFLARFGQIQ